MILAASDASHENVELLVAPEDAVVGERVRFGDSDEPQAEPQTPNQIQKKKKAIKKLKSSYFYLT